MSSDFSTDEQVASVPGVTGDDDFARAGALVDEADEMFGEALLLGEWPSDEAAARFRSSGRLGQALALYAEAMALDPDEAAYPWNLSSVLRRLGLMDLALAFSTRALRVAEQIGDDEWSGVDAHIALAELAVDADQLDTALLALARASQLAGQQPLSGDLVRGLLAEIRERDDGAASRLTLASGLLVR